MIYLLHAFAGADEKRRDLYTRQLRCQIDNLRRLDFPYEQVVIYADFAFVYSSMTARFFRCVDPDLAHPFTQRYSTLLLDQDVTLSQVLFGCLDFWPIQRPAFPPELEYADLGAVRLYPFRWRETFVQPRSLIMTGGMYFNNRSTRIRERMVRELKKVYRQSLTFDDQLILSEWFEDAAFRKGLAVESLNHRYNLGFTDHARRANECNGPVMGAHFHPEFPHHRALFYDRIVGKDLQSIFERHELRADR